MKKFQESKKIIKLQIRNLKVIKKQVNSQIKNCEQNLKTLKQYK